MLWDGGIWNRKIIRTGGDNQERISNPTLYKNEDITIS